LILTAAGEEILFSMGFGFLLNIYIQQLIMMNSLAHGKYTSSVEVTNVSARGLWLFAHNRAFFISYDDFPWFKEQTISSVTNVEEHAPGHYYWPDLDVDLSQEIIEHPQRFPLSAKIT